LKITKVLGDGEGIDGRSGGCRWVWVSVGGGESSGGGGRKSGSVGESFEDGGDGFDGGEFELIVGLGRSRERKESRSASSWDRNETVGALLTSVRSI